MSKTDVVCPVCKGHLMLLEIVDDCSGGKCDKIPEPENYFSKAIYKCSTCMFRYVNIVPFGQTPFIGEVLVK